MKIRERVLDLLGVLVVGYDEGLQLGNVSDIHVDKKTCRMTGISVRKGLSGFAEPSYVDFRNIRKIGSDVVIIANKAAVRPLPKGVEKSSLKLLKNVRIATQAGQYVGRLSDIGVAVENGDISRLMVTAGGHLDVKPRTTAVGADIIVLPSGSTVTGRKEPPAAAKARTNVDTVTSFLESATDKVIEVAKGTTKKVIETTKQTTAAATRPVKKAASAGGKTAKTVRKAAKTVHKAARKTTKASKAKRR